MMKIKPADQHFDIAEASMLQEQDDHDVAAGDDDAEDDRNAKEQIERDRRADDFG